MITTALMRLVLLFALFSFCFGAVCQDPDLLNQHPLPEKQPVDRKLPNGKSQSEEILKADHAKSLQDLKQITELSQSLAAEMERDTSHVLSLNSIRKTEEIEKLARRIRGRMRRF